MFAYTRQHTLFIPLRHTGGVCGTWVCGVWLCGRVGGGRLTRRVGDGNGNMLHDAGLRRCSLAPHVCATHARASRADRSAVLETTRYKRRRGKGRGGKQGCLGGCVTFALATLLESRTDFYHMARIEADEMEMELSGTTLPGASVKTSTSRAEWHASRGKRRGRRHGKSSGTLRACASPVLASLHFAALCPAIFPRARG